MSEEERLQLENELLLTCSKAQAINKYINELEESYKLSELWCKSQQENKQLKEELELKSGMNIAVQNLKLIEENKQLKEVIEEVREVINKMVHYGYMKNATMYMATSEKSEFGARAEILLQILDKVKDVK